ncbi:MAG: hypothetical protein K6G28_02875 [Acholeplasmatales bacterium]|nr:hypothetical protein [Acholeplasmatales bacterium]
MKKRLMWIIPLIFDLIGLIMLIIQATCFKDKFSGLFAFEMFTVTLVLIYPLIGKIFKLDLPLSLEILMCFHIFCSNYLGTAYRFYDIFPWWDLLCHGYFGLIAALVAYLVLIHVGGRKMNFLGQILFMYFLPMGCAAFWEICEYLSDQTTGGDTQHVYDAPLGVSPVADTIEDMIITFVGATLFILPLIISYFTNRKFIKFIDRDFGYISNETNKEVR